MEIVDIKEKEILRFIEDLICSSIIETIPINDNYKHSTPYSSGPSILEHGILSLEEYYRKVYGVEMSSEDKNKWSKEGGHINGHNYISLFVPKSKLSDLDPRKDTFEAASFNICFGLNDEVRPKIEYRSTENYDNEFLVYGSVPREYIRTLELRILKFIKTNHIHNCGIERAVALYNKIPELIYAISKYNLGISVVEKSDTKEEEGLLLNQSQLAQLPHIRIRK